MTLMPVEVGPATTDDRVDEEITQFLDPESPRSFFLYAGAGSGKTRSLVNALTTFRTRHGPVFRKAGRKIAVITYTNAACDEIISRVDEDPLFSVSTIHSFCWSQIGSLHHDIQTWLRHALPAEIADLEMKQSKGRAASQAARDRERSIANKRKRLEWLSRPRRFTYNPNGDNYGRDSLGHTEVLKITGHFIETKPSMQALIVSKYPILLVDESQDTSKFLINALFALEASYAGSFSLGLFGDMMQRIYPDGQPGLEKKVPDRWAKPSKLINHRSPRRLVQLGNALRSVVDDHRQMAREDSGTGLVRLFIAPANAADKPSTEQHVRERMRSITEDAEWSSADGSVKMLTLEHHMAASRLGFAELFDALDQDSRFTTSLRNGTLAGLRFYSEQVAPLVDASSRQDRFALMALLRKYSPLVRRDVLESQGQDSDPLANVRDAVSALLQIDTPDPRTTFLDILNCVAASNLFAVPDSLEAFIGSSEQEAAPNGGAESIENDQTAREPLVGLKAWRTFLGTSYRQIDPYSRYVTDAGEFSTHQGVKGREFDRVFVVMDDTDARGFMFSYEKLLGAKPLSPGDRKKMEQGEEIGIDRTRRLLYVTCTRAQKSLALLAYTDNPDQLTAAVTEQGWFDETEIERI